MPRPAWPKVPGQVQFDDAWQPVVAGRKLFLGSNVDDRVIALHTRTGHELWSFHTDGPVRFAPAVWKDRVFAVSDDGFLYCLAAEDGKLLWKFRGGPADRRILGNERLVSSWPARGGAAIADGVVYFSAGIWPSMGIFVHALDAETGTVKWTNDTTGSIWMNHPHGGAVSFGSICPQGYLAVAGKHVIVPGGRTMPAIFDRETGELVRFDFGRGGSGTAVMAADDFFIARGALFHPKTGVELNLSDISLASREHLIVPGHSGTPILAHSARGGIEEETYTDRRGAEQKRLAFRTEKEKAWEIPGSEGDEPLAMAGNLVIAERGNRVRVWDAKPAKDAKPQAVWEHEFDSPVRVAIAADDRLFVVTDDSKLHCFAAGETKPAPHRLIWDASHNPDDEWDGRVEALLRQVGTKEGYAVVAGIGSGRLIDELLYRSKLHLIALDSRQEKIDELRTRLVRSSWYAERIAAHAGDFDTINLPPYFASLIVAESSPFASGVPAAKSLARMFESLRPYGGTLAMRLSDDERAAFAKVVDEAKLANAELSREGEWTLLRRVGSLPGAGEWTHQYADAANSVVSKDSLVKAPLGVLWFGGPTNEAILPRHGHGPSPQVAGGRLVIEGANMLRAVDVYTGRVFWERELPGLGAYYDTTAHFAGAGEIGSNYVTLADRVYVVHGKSLLELDAATGETTREFLFDSKKTKEDEKPFWGFLAVSGDVLIATASPLQAAESVPSHVKRAEPGRFAAESGTLVVFDRNTGERLWSRDAKHGFRHNAIAAADGKLFCIDALTDAKLEALARRGVNPEGESQLLALDARTGKELWSTREDVFGTFLNYSAEHDVLLQAGSAYRDRAKDEVGRGMVAYRGRDGHVLWKDLSLSHGGPCLLWKDRIITNGAGGFALELLSGKPTGWSYRRTYGCNTAIGSENLLTFRSGAAGFCDMENDAGTGNIGGFRASCTANLIVADGVFNAPDYTRTCSCAYQHQTSLALVHMPEGEAWTFSAAKRIESPRVGINFGAPGDRRAPDGTLWLEYPETGGPSPSLTVKVSPGVGQAFQPADKSRTESPNPADRNVRPTETARIGDPPHDQNGIRWFARHSSSVAADEPGLAWVAASGIEFAGTMTVSIPGEGPRTGTVKLHFAEPEELKPGERVFTVRVQDKPALENLDLVRTTGAPRKALVHEIPNVTVEGSLRIDLTPAKNSHPPILCGIEFIPAEVAR
ncbi:MAG: PQQ-binding-like beta-propeller repeat protein [Planctomycetaceae bacterium]